jgi:hypothetical protein
MHCDTVPRGFDDDEQGQFHGLRIRFDRRRVFWPKSNLGVNFEACELKILCLVSIEIVAR